MPDSLGEAGPDIIIGLKFCNGLLSSGNLQIYTWDSNSGGYRQIGLLKRISLVATEAAVPVKLEATFNTVPQGPLVRALKMYKNLLSKFGVKVK